MTRRALILAAALAIAAIAAVAALTLPRVAAQPETPPPPTPAELERKLWEHASRWIQRGELARENGFIYTVDLAQLMHAAAQRGRRDDYLQIRELTVTHVVLDKKDDPFTRGFVAWRHKPVTPSTAIAPAHEPLDATGTTEALRLAEALWHGGAAFERPGDRELALLILRGYARHAATDDDIWLIRNYFNLGTRSYATNTFLVDYDPDFVRLVADATSDRELRNIADRSLSLVKQSIAPCGLIYDLVQPEVKTLTPNLPGLAFSPNDIIQLSNSVAVAERCVKGDPEIGKRVLALAWKNRSKPRNYFLGRTGEPPPEVRDHAPGSETDAGLLRLACKLGDAKAKAHYLTRLCVMAAPFAEKPVEPRAYTASELLAALIEADSK